MTKVYCAGCEAVRRASRHPSVLPAGEGTDLETWRSGRIWVEAKAVTFWEEPARPAMIREILLALNLGAMMQARSVAGPRQKGRAISVSW